jgi:3-hydroxybutyryl-CoA dehydrogenase
MQIVVLGNEELREELGEGNGNITWIRNISELSSTDNADAFLDLLFEPTPARINTLSQIGLRTTVIVNSVQHTIPETGGFTRICGWPTFLKGGLIEASTPADGQEKAEAIMASFSKKMEWVPDLPGFITPRVISMIINEAYLALEEGVSTKEQIDTAMKLGTNYPYGPFEWAQKIGINRISQLLLRLSQDQSRYAPARMLQETSEMNS